MICVNTSCALKIFDFCELSGSFASKTKFTFGMALMMVLFEDGKAPKVW